MALQIDPDGRKTTEFECHDCGETAQRVWGFVLDDGDAHAIYFASLYRHDGDEAYVDVILSPTWADDVDDHETFGCRVGTIENQEDPGASLVTGGAAAPDTQLFGHKLTREEAMANPRLDEFWQVVDHILESDPLVRQHVFGPDAQEPVG
jgi:hypothetical protein